MPPVLSPGDGLEQRLLGELAAKPRVETQLDDGREPLHSHHEASAAILERGENGELDLMAQGVAVTLSDIDVSVT